MVACGERIGHAACFFFYNFYLVFFDLNFVFDLLSADLELIVEILGFRFIYDTAL